MIDPLLYIDYCSSTMFEAELGTPQVTQEYSQYFLYRCSWTSWIKYETKFTSSMCKSEPMKTKGTCPSGGVEWCRARVLWEESAAPSSAICSGRGAPCVCQEQTGPAPSHWDEYPQSIPEQITHWLAWPLQLFAHWKLIHKFTEPRFDCTNRFAQPFSQTSCSLKLHRFLFFPLFSIL